jgi:hypothetical protein
MRPFFVLSAVFTLLVSISAAPPTARAQNCTGPDCAQQGQDHQCEREKKEEVTS